MISIFFIILSCISFFVLTVESSSSEQPAFRIYSAEIMNNPEFIRLILESLKGDLSLRLISKAFRDCHDRMCSFNLSSIDPRLNLLLKNENDEKITTPLCPTLQVEIPMFYLFRNHFKDYFYLVENGLNISYPILADDDAVQRGVDRKRAGLTDFDAQKAFRIYAKAKLIISSFAPDEYMHILIKQSSFPNTLLLENAAMGRLPDPYNKEILVSFLKTFTIYPLLVRLSFEVGRVDLARLVLMDPHMTFIFHSFDGVSFGHHVMALDYAARSGEIDLIARCIELGANPMQLDAEFLRPIHHAALNNQWDAVMFLFQYDHQSATLSTLAVKAPIILAALDGQNQIFQSLLSHDMLSLDSQLVGELYNIAIESSNYDLGNILLESGKLDLPDSEIERLVFLDFQNI